MGALNPLFLLAAAAVAVPVFLHLFQRQEAKRLAFPALRYLQRTEREHARRIRLRQLLLLLLRSAVILLLVGAGARVFLRGRGAAHPPTALAIVLDNSLSSGLVVGEERVLDRLKAVATRTLEGAGEDDRIWVVRAGEPWLPATPGGREAAARRVAESAATDARGDLSAALRRAAELVSTAGLEAAEIHLLSDLQATAFDDAAPVPAGRVPVVVWAPPGPRASNRGLVRALVGGGLPPLEGAWSDVAVELSAGPPGDTVPVPVRVVLAERVRAAGVVPAGASLALPLPATPAGWVLGYVEADADGLRADDRRYFAYRARPAPTVSVAGDPGGFVADGLAVLEEAGRIRAGPARGAAAVISGSGEGLGAVGTGGAVLVLPPSDPTRLPGMNRRLSDAGVPWRLERAGEEGEADLAGAGLPEPLAGVRARWWYRLVPAGDPPAPTRTLATAGPDRWAVEGTDAAGRRYLLLASPLDAASSSLPVSAAMIRFVDWFAGQWAATAGSGREHAAGEPLAAPRAAETVRLPSGEEIPLDGTRTVRATGQAGLYTFLAGDSVVAVEAVNPPVAESDLTTAETDGLHARIGVEVTVVRREDGWERAVFRARRGPELWRTLVLAALALLLVEGAVAAAGPLPRGRRAARGAGTAHGAA